ncbi:MAG: MFS transporter [Clostridia bacterium]|nr:MFS transporter [Clostridia bacterium]
MAGKIRNTKKFAVPIHTCAQFLFSCLYLIPFLSFDDSVRRVVFVVCIFLSYFGNYFVTAIVFKWGNSFVDPRKRASFSSVKEMISLLSGMVVSLSLGYAIENLDKSGNVTYGFLLSAVCMLIFCVSDFICLMTIRKEYIPQASEEEKPESPKFRDVMKNTLGNRNFIKITVLHCLWAAARVLHHGFSRHIQAAGAHVHDGPDPADQHLRRSGQVLHIQTVRPVYGQAFLCPGDRARADDSDGRFRMQHVLLALAPVVHHRVYGPVQHQRRRNGAEHAEHHIRVCGFEILRPGIGDQAVSQRTYRVSGVAPLG